MKVLLCLCLVAYLAGCTRQQDPYRALALELGPEQDISSELKSELSLPVLAVVLRTSAVSLVMLTPELPAELPGKAKQELGDYLADYPTWRLAFEEGAPPKSAMRGELLIYSLFRELEHRSHALKRVGLLSGDERWRRATTQLLVLMEREVEQQVFEQLSYTAGQAGIARYHIAFLPDSSEPSLARDEEPRSKALDAAGEVPVVFSSAPRPDPLVPLRRGSTARSTTQFVADETEATFSIEVPRWDGTTLSLEDLLLSSPHRGSLEWLLGQTEAPVYPSFSQAAAAAAHPVLAAVEHFGFETKLQVERFVAAVESALEKPGGKLELGRQAWLGAAIEAQHAHWRKAPVAAKQAHQRALVFLAAAALLGKAELPAGLPDNITEAAQQAAKRFLKEHPHVARPGGVYTSTAELERVFVRDRFLMQAFDPRSPEQLDTALALAAMLATEPGLAAELVAIATVYAKLTNPSVGMSLGELVALEPAAALIDESRRATVLASTRELPLERGIHLLAPARNHEAELIRSRGGLYSSAGVSMELLIESVRSGLLDLTPAASSGYYDHHQYALAALLRLHELPEGAKLRPSSGYHTRLELAFASMVAMHRETHLKVLEAIPIGAGPANIEIVYLAPELSLEPLPSHYLRMARALGFLRQQALVAADEAPASALAQLEQLYYGLYLLAAVEIGIRPELLPEEIPDASAALRLARARLEAPAAQEDIRSLVPIGSSRTGLVYWAILGVMPLDIVVSYRQPPEVSLVDSQAKLVLELGSSHYTLLVPVFAEIDSRSQEPISTAELRAICDEHKTRAAIIRALEAGGG